MTVPSSPVPIGPGVVMAQDNTIGSYSPYEGRIYAAFVGYYNVTVRLQEPHDQHRHLPVVLRRRRPDLEHPVQVNDDNGADRRLLAGRATISPDDDQFTGTSQYQPAIAVDQTTGTVVLSWRDARNDPTNNTLAATYITASIDGGNTFNDQVYANPE